MRRWLTVLACTFVPAAAAGAQPMNSLSRPLSDEPRKAPTPSFRLVQPSPLDPSPIRQSGMIMDTEVAPNTTLGLGLFSVSKKNSMMDWRPDSRAPKSRKVGIGIKMRF